MEQYMIMDEKLKKRMGIICFLPAIAFGTTLIYYLILLSPLLYGHPQPKSVVAITSENYGTLFIMLAISATISASVLIYCLLHLLRIKTLNTPTKIQWALLLVGLEPFSFVLFWFFQLRKERKYMPVYPDIS